MLVLALDLDLGLGRPGLSIDYRPKVTENCTWYKLIQVSLLNLNC